MRIYIALNATEVRETFLTAIETLEEYFSIVDLEAQFIDRPKRDVLMVQQIVDAAEEMNREDPDGDRNLRGLIVYLRWEEVDCIFWND